MPAKYTLVAAKKSKSLEPLPFDTLMEVSDEGRWLEYPFDNKTATCSLVVRTAKQTRRIEGLLGNPYACLVPGREAAVITLDWPDEIREIDLASREVRKLGLMK